jgi:putative pyruvate formate lyase activating enzyme
MAFEPAYMALHRSGALKQRGETLYQRMGRCDLCPRECGTDRLSGDRGFCGANALLEVASHHPHFGEEAPLVGARRIGNDFFTHCSLRCVFCINREISQGARVQSGK